MSETLHNHTALAQITGHRIRKMARQQKLADTTFKTFRAIAFPDATPDQIEWMRIFFFAGMAEVWALQMYGLHVGSEPTQADEDFMSSWVHEVEAFHRKTIATLMAKSEKPN